MHRLIIVLLLLFFISSSCKKGTPRGILSEKEMIALFTDMHILDGYLVSLSPDSARKVIDPLYEELFLKYDLDSNSFKNNLVYYYGNPKLNERTYTEVVKNLELEEREFVKMDSIKNAVYQDSVNRTMKEQRIVNQLNNMILNAKSDSINLTILDYSRRTFENSGISFLLEKNFFHGAPLKLPKDSTALKNSPVLDSLVKKPSLPDTLKLKEQESPSLRVKPVLPSKRKHQLIP
ncbi:DUF4296 domain-containing protein [Sphingobacterium sp. HJSM2_6]|uniref:DUF4296 domain-containing protein n=1 Tax=Sphingobacterium sp. HJSM2_6 TaxID=3366264 RepID=UPI003BCD5DD8